MIHYLTYLVRNRISAKPFSYNWYRLWGKRLINIFSLVGVLIRVWKLSRNGSKIGFLSVIGRNIELNGKASLLSMGRECVIGSGVHLALHDEIRLGDYVVVNDKCTLLTASHDIESPVWAQVHAPIIIEDFAWIATNSIILPGVTIGYAAIVGAGAVVTKDVPAYQVVGGNPARCIKRRSTKHLNYSPARFLAAYEAWLGLPRG